MNCAWVMPNSFRHLSLNSHHYCSLMNEMLKQVQHDGMWLLTSTTTFKAVCSQFGNFVYLCSK